MRPIRPALIRRTCIGDWRDSRVRLLNLPSVCYRQPPKQVYPSHGWASFRLAGYQELAFASHGLASFTCCGVGLAR